MFLINKYTGEPERAEPLIDAAVAAAEASGDAATIRQALAIKGTLLRQQGRIPESMKAFAGLQDLMSGADALDRLNYRRYIWSSAFLAGDLETAERSAQETATLAEPMGPHNRTHAWDDLCDVHFARSEWPRVVEVAHRTARLVQEEKASAFCRSAAGIIAQGAGAHALAGHRDEAMALLRAIPSTDIIEQDLVSGLPRALLGFPSPETDERLRSGKWAWWEWAEAAMRAVVLRRPDDAEEALRQMGPVLEGSPTYAALAEGVREAVAELRGGRTATFASLRKLGLNGWAEILRRRVDAEY